MRTHIILITVFIVAGSVTLSAIPAFSGEAAAPITIILGANTSFEREKPPVVFDHDKHLKQGTACTSCHYADASGEKICFKTRGSDKTSKRLYMNGYHEQCLTCHERSLAKYPAVPVLCGGCHADENAKAAAPPASVFVHESHTRAVKSLDSCKACHQEPLKADLTTINGCGSCHKDQKLAAMSTPRTDAHARCLSCHFTGKDRGSFSCEFCHHEQTPPTVTRIMPKATFDHDLHAETADCKTCHVLHEHASPHFAAVQQDCVACHQKLADKTYVEKEKVSSFDLHHKSTFTFGCVGCHIAMGSGPEYGSCSDCHAVSTPQQ